MVNIPKPSRFWKGSPATSHHFKRWGMSRRFHALDMWSPFSASWPLANSFCLEVIQTDLEMLLVSSYFTIIFLLSSHYQIHSKIWPGKLPFSQNPKKSLIFLWYSNTWIWNTTYAKQKKQKNFCHFALLASRFHFNFRVLQSSTEGRNSMQLEIVEAFPDFLSGLFLGRSHLKFWQKKSEFDGFLFIGKFPRTKMWMSRFGWTEWMVEMMMMMIRITRKIRMIRMIRMHLGKLSWFTTLSYGQWSLKKNSASFWKQTKGFRSFRIASNLCMTHVPIMQQDKHRHIMNSKQQTAEKISSSNCLVVSVPEANPKDLFNPPKKVGWFLFFVAGG